MTHDGVGLSDDLTFEGVLEGLRDVKDPTASLSPNMTSTRRVRSTLFPILVFSDRVGWGILRNPPGNP